jgi:hypothetical protein
VCSAHERRVFKLALHAFAMWVDMVNGEITPRQLMFASRMQAGPVCGCVPNDTALLGGETTLAVSFGE